MSKPDDLIHTIDAAYAAAIDSEKWPAALAAATRLIGGIGGTLEVLDKQTLRPIDFYSWGIPKASELEYFADYAPLSPRSPVGFRLDAGSIAYDSLVLDERAMRRDAFYSDFLARAGFRYFVSSNIAQNSKLGVPFAVQRSAKQGHVGRREIALMRRLTPHLQQAYDTARRLKDARAKTRTFEQALDWLSDGMALVNANGTIAHANEAMLEIAQRGDGIRIAKGRIDLSGIAARTRLAEALGRIGQLRDGAHDAAGGDFTVQRERGAPSYVISVRPLPHRDGGAHESDALAIVFVHDPAAKDDAVIHAMRDAFGFTEAEAALAAALKAGQTLVGYARGNGISHNTIYWHLRRIKEKTGCTRLPELIHKLNGLQIRIRP